MNFFEEQQRARRISGRLLLLLAVAVLGLIAVTSLALGVGLHFYALQEGYELGPRFEEKLVLFVALVILAVVFLGGLYKHSELRQGGKVVAERLGGRLISLAPQDLAEQRLLNVVEEMALAAGLPVPAVYVLDDGGINAFAAGLTPRDAVIGITRGALTRLDRDQLQGVIAHEFSHILHGDMRLNLQLVALLHGLLLVALMGEFLLRSQEGRSSRSSKDNSAAVIFMIGGALWLLGAVGNWCGKLIRAAVSRQREYLADASAVQFTRNPEGIAGALLQIGAGAGSQLHAAHAAEFSHLYFAQGLRLSSLWATHPPLEERIRRILPRWDGAWPKARAAEPLLVPANQASGVPSGAASLLDERIAALRADLPAARMDESIAASGAPAPEHVGQARELLRGLPANLRAAAHHGAQAQALACGLMLAREPASRAAQLALLGEQLAGEVAQHLRLLDESLLGLAPDQRLALLDLCLPALKALAQDGQARLKAALKALAQQDGVVSLAEWSLFRIVERNLQPPRPVQAQFHLVELADEAALLLSALAWVGADSRLLAEDALARAAVELPFTRLELRSADASVTALDLAVRRLALIWPLQKPRLLKAMARCIEHDGVVRPAEAELLRAVADSLDCPLPPLLPG